MKKLILVSLALVIVCASLYASLPDKNREGIVIPPIYDNIDDNSMEINSMPREHREGIIIPPIYYAEDNSMELNSAPVDYREGIIVPPIYYADNNSVEMLAEPNRRRGGIVIPPCPNDSNANHNLMKANPNKRRGGIIIPPINCDPFNNSKTKNTIELTNVNGTARVNMYDVTGKLVLETEVSKYVDVSRVPSGKYIMIVTSGGQTVAGKVTVIK
ncbi:MAG: T9SS type A sorting domain-containing protein [bacterium]|nr:T9SS type A sorting domain-containing protein [bacterium]